MSFDNHKKRNPLIALLALPLVAGIGAGEATAQDSWVITQLSNGISSPPEMSGSNVIWEYFDGQDDEILLYNGTATVQITDNTYPDQNIRTSDSHVAWIGRDGGLGGIFVYDIDTGLTTRVPAFDDGTSGGGYCISDSHVAWSVYRVGYGSLEVFVYNLDTQVTTQLTNNSEQEHVYGISGSYLVWSIRQPDNLNLSKLFLCNIDSGVITPISPDHSYHLHDVRMSGSNVVWAGQEDGSDDVWQREVFVFDGSTTIQLTDNALIDEFIDVSGENVVWHQGGGVDTEVYLYNISTGITTQLTNNSYDDSEPRVSGSNVAWLYWNDDDAGVMFYDGATPIQVTSYADDVCDTRISGRNVAWTQEDATGNWEIFLATAVSPDPVALLLDLAQDIIALNLQHGIENSLDVKLDSALQALADINANNNVAAINSLQAFINAVAAQSGSHIPVDDANALIAAAQEIINLLSS